MKNRKISEAIGHLDGDLVSEAASYQRTSAKIRALRWSSLAACLMVAVMAAVLLIPAANADAVFIGEIERIYKKNFSAGESGYYVFPWEYRTDSERYTEIELGGVVYRARGEAVREALLGDSLGICTAKGWDEYSEESRTGAFTARKINGVSEERAVAVGMDGAYYVYLKMDENAPATLGELFALYGLEDNLTLTRFSVYENGKEKGYFQMKDGSDITALLSEYQNAPAWVEAEAQGRPDGDYISFTATSESLGVYKKVFYVTADGYISTNMFEYRYVYEIGEEAANRIISYAKANAEKAASEPYESILAGTVTEIGDGYLLIDDTALCKNPKDGLVFRVPTDDIRIRRSVELGRIKVGDTVAVRFRGLIDPDTLTVTGARGIDKGVIVDGGIAIPK